MNVLVTGSLNYPLHSNGLQQNIIFLCDMLTDMGYSVFVVVNHDLDDCVIQPSNVTIMEEDEVGDYKFNYVLQASFFLRNKTIDIIKSRNNKSVNVHVQYGNRMFADIENCASHDMRYINHKVDEVWVSPHYEKSIPYYKSLYNTQKVYIIPYIWSSKYIDINKDNCIHDSSKPKKIAVLEPNISVSKSCLIPILIAQELFNQDPNSFDRLHVYCSKNFRSKKHFQCWMWNLNLQQNNKIIFLDRKNVHDILAKECSIILSHQLMNGLNYIYLEALYLGIPLVHNSEYIKDCGFYYPDYDTQEGAKKLKLALEMHEQSSLSQALSKKHQDTLYKFSPDNPSVRKQYKQLLA